MTFISFHFQVPVKSISEFQKLYVSGLGLRKSAQTMATELPRRGHKGLIVHVLAPNEKSDTLLLGKMNFVDLAGYIFEPYPNQLKFSGKIIFVCDNKP